MSRPSAATWSTAARPCPAARIGVDTIGVKITYHYTWFTPMGSFIGLGITDYYMNESNAMRMEPVL